VEKRKSKNWEGKEAEKHPDRNRKNKQKQRNKK
jgi:hypothetical protein